MKCKYYFKVAELAFVLELPDHLNLDIASLLSSFAFFQIKEKEAYEIGFTMSCFSFPIPFPRGNAVLLEESENDLGNIRLLKTDQGVQI